MKQVMQHLNNMKSLCSVLGLDFKHTVTEVHPGLTGSEDIYSITNATLQSLESALKRLRELKVQRMQKLKEFQDLATTMLELWNLMDTPLKEQQAFQNVTCNVASSEHELNEPNILASDFIAHVEAEVTRLEELKNQRHVEFAKQEAAPMKGGSPQGFFHNKDADLRARDIEPVKPDIKRNFSQAEIEQRLPSVRS